MSDTEESKTEDIQSAEVENKLGKLGKYLSLATISILWVVTAVLGIRDLWIGKGIIETPWVIFSIVLTVVIIFLVVLPLLRSLKEDVRDYNKRKEEESQEEKVELED
ncbi:MAG: hypothetical protein HeimAB125_22290 [Candidatus Heimdallarchaeota archaeon AB_125]|nr:MAG: hypothetical protein HeimAB125_22290 [Candidatus Heimdallarchaeota archaeon AB_125]